MRTGLAGIAGRHTGLPLQDKANFPAVARRWGRVRIPRVRPQQVSGGGPSNDEQGAGQDLASSELDRTEGDVWGVFGRQSIGGIARFEYPAARGHAVRLGDRDRVVAGLLIAGTGHTAISRPRRMLLSGVDVREDDPRARKDGPESESPRSKAGMPRRRRPPHGEARFAGLASGRPGRSESSGCASNMDIMVAHGLLLEARTDPGASIRLQRSLASECFTCCPRRAGGRSRSLPGSHGYGVRSYGDTVVNPAQTNTAAKPRPPKESPREPAPKRFIGILLVLLIGLAAYGARVSAAQNGTPEATPGTSPIATAQGGPSDLRCIGIGSMPELQVVLEIGVRVGQTITPEIMDRIIAVLARRAASVSPAGCDVVVLPDGNIQVTLAASPDLDADAAVSTLSVSAQLEIVDTGGTAPGGWNADRSRRGLACPVGDRGTCRDAWV